MSNPLFKALKFTPPPGGSASVETALLIQASEAVRAVADDLNHMARYGKIENVPSAVNLQGVRMQDEDWTLAVIVVAYPDARADGAGEFIKSAFNWTLAEHRKARGANPPKPPENGEPE